MAQHFPCHWEGCPKTFSFKSAKEVHYKREHLKIRFPCPECDKTYGEKRARDQHVRKAHDKINKKTEKIPCPECDLTFALKQGLAKHKRNKHGGGVFPCPECDTVKENKDQLEYHVKTVHLKVSFDCCVCGETRASRQNLTTHMLKKHPDYKEEVELVVEKSPKKIKIAPITPANNGVEFLLGIQDELKDTSTEMLYVSRRRVMECVTLVREMWG